MAGGAASPEAAVAAYVAAFDARDGAGICRLLAPKVADTIGPALDEWTRTVRTRSCAAALDEDIVRPSDAAAREVGEDEGGEFWSRASIVSRGRARRDGDRASVRLRLRHRFLRIDAFDSSRDRTVREVDDRLWLQRRGGRWFVARVGGIFHVATRFPQGPWTFDGPLTAAAARRPARLPAPPSVCRRPARRIVRYADHDRPSTRTAAHLDIETVSVRRMRAGGACVSVTLSAPPRLATEVRASVTYRFNRPELIAYPGGRFLGHAAMSLRFDSAGRTHGGLFRGPGEAGGSCGGRGNTMVFYFGPARGGDQIRPRVEAFTEDHRGVGPVRARRADTFPPDTRSVRPLALSRPLPASCTPAAG